MNSMKNVMMYLPTGNRKRIKPVQKPVEYTEICLLLFLQFQNNVGICKNKQSFWLDNACLYIDSGLFH